jgi:hypothetical protein
VPAYLDELAHFGLQPRALDAISSPSRRSPQVWLLRLGGGAACGSDETTADTQLWAGAGARCGWRPHGGRPTGARSPMARHGDGDGRAIREEPRSGTNCAAEAHSDTCPTAARARRSRLTARATRRLLLQAPPGRYARPPSHGGQLPGEAPEGADPADRVIKCSHPIMPSAPHSWPRACTPFRADAESGTYNSRSRGLSPGTERGAFWYQ